MRQWRVRIGDWSVAVPAASRRDAVIAAVERAIRQRQTGLWTAGQRVYVTPI